MTYYPVCIATLNRYEHFKECVESLAACTHADKTELVISLDYPPSEKYVEGWKKIKEYLPTIKGFGKVTIFEQNYNLGVGRNGNGAFLRRYVTGKYDAWIGIEDDNVFSPCFLDYMDKCLEKYKDDKSVFAISGYMQPIDWGDLNKTESNVIHIQEYMGVLGNWKNRIEIRETIVPRDFLKYICSSKKKLYKLRHKSLRDLYQLISWLRNNPSLDYPNDFTIACALKINDLCVISPVLSLVRNKGFDGSGLNCGYDELKKTIYDMQEISDKKIFEIKDVMSKKELHQFRQDFEKYMCSRYGNNFDKKSQKAALKYYYLYMILGYKLAQKFLCMYEKLFYQK